MLKRRFALVGTASVLLMAGCGITARPSPEDQAATIVAGTLMVAMDTPPPTTTPVPSNTSAPISTPTQPTEIPTMTPLPGPVKFSDDFSEDAGFWLDCRGCKWQDGLLIMGPYSPAAPIETLLTVCEPCGTPTYMRIAVDVTHVEGQTDRGYGLVYRLTDDTIWDFEISPLFLLTVGFRYDILLQRWDVVNPNPDQLFSGLVKPGRATNRLELIVQPIGAAAADIYFKVNGKNAFVLYNKPVEPGRVGLIVGFHSVQVAFDNFEFDELEP